MDDILARLKATDDPKSTPSAVNGDGIRPRAVNNILANLNDQLKKQQIDLSSENSSKGPNGSSDSEALTPASGSFAMVSACPSSHADTSQIDIDEMNRLKEELANAKCIITRQDQELTETRNFKHTMDQAMGPPSEADLPHQDGTEPVSGPAQRSFNATARPFTAREDGWLPPEDARSQFSDGFSGNSNFGPVGGPWNNHPQQQPTFGNGLNPGLSQQLPFTDRRAAYSGEQNWNRNYGSNVFASQGGVSANHRVLSGPTAPTYAMDGRYTNEQTQYPLSGGNRRSMSQYNRSGSSYSGRNNFYGNYGASVSNIAPAGNGAPLGYGSAFGYQPRPIGTPLSPTATEFTTAGSTLSGTTLGSFGGQWPSVSFPNAISAVLKYLALIHLWWSNLRVCFRAAQLPSTP